MGILDAYQDSTDTALRVMATQPLTPEPVTPKHSTWSSPFRAVAAGAAEVVGNVMDTAGAFGQVAAAAGGLTPGFDPDARKNRNDTVGAFDKLKTEGINWRTDEAQQAYKFGADLRPDPLTAGTAENLVFSLTKGLTKAIGAAVALGPVGGAAAFGASEGMTTAEDLANQGVDQATRTKVGAVTAGFNAAGVLLPVAGQTLKQTAGLVLTGGPLSFMAQQAATREILRNADYKTIAEQYDPLDPVGLTVATLLPAGFAAYAKRGGFGPKAAPESIDAAMVQNITARADAHGDVAPEQMPAMFGADEAQAIAPLPAVKDSLTTQPDPSNSVVRENQTTETPDAYAARVNAIAKDQPDLIARLDDAGQPVKLSDELAAIKKQAQEGTDTDFGALDAPLLKTALECALSLGAA
jgi:hypothetical protein